MTTASDLVGRDFQLSPLVRLAICCAAFAVTALPLLLIEHLPFVDYPNHLARFHIWQNLDTSEHLSKYYQRQSGLHPYWAMRLFVNGLSGIIGLETAGRLFVILATLMPAIGACCVGWVIAKRLTLLPLASLSVTYNYLVAWGFHNYLFAGGLALVVFALWIAVGSGRSWQRTATMAVLALVLAFMHLLSVALLALLILVWETAELFVSDRPRRRWKSVISTCIQLAVIFLPALLFYGSLDASALGDKTNVDGGLLLRFVSFMSPFVLYGTELDVIFNGAPLLLMIAALCAGAFKLPKRAFVVLSVLLIVAVLLPYKVYGVAINWRLPIFLVVLVFAFARAAEGEAGIRNCIGIAIAALVVFRVADVTVQLTRQSNEIAELLQVSEEIEPGSRVLPVFAGTTSEYYMISDDDRRAHYAGYLVLRKEIMFPLQFIQYDIGFRGRFADIIAAGGKPLSVSDLGRDAAYFAAASNRPISYAIDWRKDYDYLLVIGNGATPQQLSGTRLVARGSYFQIRKLTDSPGD